MSGLTFIFKGQQNAVPCMPHVCFKVLKLTKPAISSILYLTEDRGKGKKIASGGEATKEDTKEDIAWNEDDKSKIVCKERKGESQSDPSLSNHCSNTVNLSDQVDRPSTQIHMVILSGQDLQWLLCLHLKLWLLFDSSFILYISTMSRQVIEIGRSSAVFGKEA